MKKLFTLIITVVLLVSVASLSVSAVEPKNFVAADATWDSFYATSVETKDGVLTAVLDASKAWSSPSINLLPAIKDALGDKEEVEFVLTFKIKANYKAGTNIDSTSSKVLFRGTNGLYVTKDEWAAVYEEMLDGEAPVFTNSDGNILHYIENSLVYDEEWTEVYIELAYTKGQIECEAVTKWNLCFDKTDTLNELESIQIKDLGIYLLDDAPEAEEGGEDEGTTDEGTEDGGAEAKPTATAKPATQKPATQKPTQTKAPEASATAEATPGTVTNTSNGGSVFSDPAVVIVVALSGAVVVASAATIVLVLLKKKKQ